MKRVETLNDSKKKRKQCPLEDGEFLLADPKRKVDAEQELNFKLIKVHQLKIELGSYFAIILNFFQPGLTE